MGAQFVRPIITFTPTLLARLKHDYVKARKAQQESFIFHTLEQGDHEFLVRYAKYLIDYLDAKFYDAQ